ncbi:MAG: phage terminase large subunit family protein, partial [Clostridia bacterium]|nr:phage terminase large subunit family protein [Clostridia bacterium]
MNEKQVDGKTVNLFRNIAKILSPPPELTVSQWADNYRKLSQEASSEPGQWNTNRAPYQREIMDAVNDAGCEEVIIMSSAQVGKTELLLNVIGYYIDYDPSPILCLQPTLEMAQTFSKDRLVPMLRDTPVLRGKVKDARARDSGNTILHKTFPGG